MSRLRRFLSSFKQRIGPGVITGAADDDPSGIATYTTAGAQFGYRILWTPLFTLPLMAAIQEMCARIGIVTRHGLAGAMRRHFPRPFLYGVAAVVFLANTTNIAADVSAVSASVQLLFPSVPAIVVSVVFTLGLALLMARSSYATIARIFKWLTLVLFFYIAAAILAHPSWTTMLRQTVFPAIELNRSFFLVLVAVLGTTISPYLFFWQAATDAEEEQIKRHLSFPLRYVSTERDVKVARQDVFLGMSFSNVVMYFIMAAAAATLHASGMTTIATAADAAQALEPLAGPWSALFFTLGIIGTGALAIPVLAGSAAYAVSEAFGWRSGLNQPFHKAGRFYAVLFFSTLLGLVLTWFNVDPITLLFYTAVLYGVISPPLITLILLIANDRRIMGNYINSRTQNALGIVTLVVMTASLVPLLW